MSSSCWGNLYREISDSQCIALLKQSIDFLRYYPFCVDYRPTVITVPKADSSSAIDLLPRFELLQKEYAKLIAKDFGNAVLGKREEYCALYSKDELIALRQKEPAKMPKTADEWMIPVAQNLDLDKIDFPVILVQEYGLNLFRLGAGSTLYLEELDNVEIKRECKVANITKNKNRWKLSYEDDAGKHSDEYDYLINAAGFRTGEIDDMIGVACKRMVEFKAAYVTQCDTKGVLWPEVIFHGERGTPRGMAQFTPYPNGHFQLHGMTTEITLFNNGLASSTSSYVQPKLDNKFVTKIEKGWQEQAIEERTKAAIKHLAQFIPNFATAKVASKPLYGAQQIPGNDPDLRVAEVSFPKNRYARCEIVKVSSALDMADAIISDMSNLNLIPARMEDEKSYKHLEFLQTKDIGSRAKLLCSKRGYPEVLADRCVASRHSKLDLESTTTKTTRHSKLDLESTVKKIEKVL